jgi:hypothetical protein
MKYICNLLIAFSLISFACFAEEKIPTVQENREKAGELLSQLELDLSRFLSRREKYQTASEKFLREEGMWNEFVKDNKALQRKILRQRRVFVNFRDNLVKTISLVYGKNPLGENEASIAELEITEWYVNFMREEVCL